MAGSTIEIKVVEGSIVHKKQRAATRSNRCLRHESQDRGWKRGEEEEKSRVDSKVSERKKVIQRSSAD